MTQPSVDPNAFAERVQADADEVDRETTREIGKHPDRKHAKEAYARAFQKDAAELIEFVSKNSLRSTTLDAGNPEANGWVFFSTSSKWISGWKKEEDFVLRIPLDRNVFEFPFKLPPKPGEVWRINFYAMKNNGGVAWSPILGQGNFHKASRFGRVTWAVPGAPAVADAGAITAALAVDGAVPGGGIIPPPMFRDRPNLPWGMRGRLPPQPPQPPQPAPQP